MSSKKRNLISFRNLMESDKFLFFTSLIIAFAIWIAVAMYASPAEKTTVTVPISIDTANGIVNQNKYEIYGTYTKTVDITVEGPRYLISSLNGDDFEAVAKTSDVDSAGLSNLPIKVSVKNNKKEITITDQSTSTISVYFDAMENKEFEIEVDDSKIKSSIPENYYLNSLTPLTTTLKITGPKTEVDKVKRVIVLPSSTDTLTKTCTLDTRVSLEGSDAEDTVTVNEFVSFEETVKVKIDIWKNTDIKTRVILINNSNNFVAKINPETINVSIDTEFLENTEFIDIATIDCTNITDNYVKKIYSSDITLDKSMKFNDEYTSYTVSFSSEKSN